MDIFFCLASFLASRIISSSLAGSRFPVGSSNTISPGCCAMALAIAIFCLSPPDSSETLRIASSSSFISFIILSTTLLSLSAALTPKYESRPSIIESYTDNVPNCIFCGTYAIFLALWLLEALVISIPS